MTVSRILETHFRETELDVTIFCLLIFISANLVVASFWNMCRENYAIDPGNLRHVRSILVFTTTLQLICFIGYWLGVYAMYELCWILWLTLSTFSIVLLGIRFGESYIILATPNYSLLNHNKIPNKYKYLTLSFWFIGCCVDITGTIFGIMSNVKVQSICYLIWEIARSISVAFLIYILKSVRDRFKDINTKKIQYKKQRSKATESIRKKIGKTRNKSMLTQEQKEESNNVKSVKYEGSATAISNASNIGSINYSLLTDVTDTGNRINSEIKRMQLLIIGLFFLICVFMLNAIFNGFCRFSPHLFFMPAHLKSDDVYYRTPTYIVAGIFFPQWTVINVFIMMFSWIPRNQMFDDYEE